MAEENTEVIEEPELKEEPAELDNASLKANPTFKKVTSELAQLRQEKADREAAEADSKAKAETEKLEAEGNYKAALELRDKQFKEQADKHAKDILKRDLKSELLTIGFKNQTFLNGAIAGFEGEADGIAEYVKTLAADENNKSLLGEVQRNVLNETPPPGSTPAAMTIEQAKSLRSSPDKKIQAQAFEVVDAYFDKHGMIP